MANENTIDSEYHQHHNNARYKCVNNEYNNGHWTVIIITGKKKGQNEIPARMLDESFFVVSIISEEKLA